MVYESNALPSEQIKVLTELANEMSSPGVDPNSLYEEQLQVIDDAIQQMGDEGDLQGIVWLRQLFNPLLARDTAIAIPQLQRLDDRAITAAEQVGDPLVLAPLLDEHGRNLHKQGFHQPALSYFDRATEIYREAGAKVPALHSYYMTASCYRAIGNVEKAQQILDAVIDQTDPEDPWLGNPLQVQGWLLRNEGRLVEAEATFRRALALQRQLDDSDILVAGTLADIGEVLGLQGEISSAKQHLQESLSVLAKYSGQYNRHVARAKLKLAEILIFEKNYGEALGLLNSANDQLCNFNESASGTGHYYDVLWRIELLESLIYFKTGYIGKAVQKFRSTLRYRQVIGLSFTVLVSLLIKRLRATLRHQRNSTTNSASSSPSPS